MRMLIAPVIFVTVVLGIAGVSDLKKVGPVGAKAVLYFEVVSTLALAIGPRVMNVVQPGQGFHVNRVVRWFFDFFRFMNHIKSELFTVLGTSSSESALVPFMDKLERLGGSRSVVGLVAASGYSFNLDGTTLYMTMAALFIAQALDIHLTLGQQLSLLAVAMLSSKGLRVSLERASSPWPPPSRWCRRCRWLAWP